MHRLGATAIVFVLLAGCDATAKPSSSPGSPSASPVLFSPVATPTSRATNEPAPTAPAAAATPVALPAGATWQRFGAVGEATVVRGALVFRGRYLAFGEGEQSLPWAWTSAGGDAWQGTGLGRTIVPCPGYAEDYDSQVYRGATDGRQVVLVGLEYAVGAPTCPTHRAASWVSQDGVTWQRGRGFGGNVTFAEAEDVWATATGWEALAHGATEDPSTLWRSADGLTWTEVGLDVPAPLSVSISAGADGIRLMVITNDEGAPGEETLGVATGTSRLRWSNDGTTWNDVAHDFSAQGGTRLRVVVDKAPATGNAWIVVGDHENGGDENGGPPTIWRSTDLVDWQQAPFPRLSLDGLAWTRYGYMAMGSDPGCGDGGPCPTTDPAMIYVSPDGVGWTAMDAAIDGYVFIDGPAGVLTIDGEANVWVLR
jgi:hypothetical protein